MRIIANGGVMEFQEPYEVLGVAPEATDAEIRAAYAAILDEIKAGKLAPKEAQEVLNSARMAFPDLSCLRASFAISQHARQLQR